MFLLIAVFQNVYNYQKKKKHVLQYISALRQVLL